MKLIDKILTKREHEVMRLICKGYSNKQIAEKLVVTLATVQTHVKHIMNKLGISTYTKIEKNVKRLRMAILYLREHPELLLRG